jgi:hypothetical protein
MKELTKEEFIKLSGRQALDYALFKKSLGHWDNKKYIKWLNDWSDRKEVTYSQQVWWSN